MPGLVVFSTVCGILGGFIIGVFYMGLSPSAFLHELWNVIFLKDVLVTLFKTVIFAWIIVWIAAQQGFSAYGGSEAVGRVTTSSVVLSIFWCIIADALFSILFYF
jgi:phospholipid/cholesterol/gamma-HCH transport system permease protein